MAGLTVLLSLVLSATVATAAPVARDRIADADAVLRALDALPPTPNTAWGYNPATQRVEVTISAFAPAAGADRLRTFASRMGDRVRIVRTPRPFVEHVLGGAGIDDGSIVCSAGFNVVRGGQNYLLTAGHCTAGLPTWSGIGPSVASNYPGTDFGLIRNDNDDAPGAVDLYNGSRQPISRVGVAVVGQRVCASGWATKLTCGTVTAVNQTVDYGNGNVVHGLIKTTVHTDHGDSGGPLFSGSLGLGMVSGGDGTTDYFQPLGPVLVAYHVSLA